METKSIWEKYSKKTEIKILKNNLDIDVAIVGIKYIVLSFV